MATYFKTLKDTLNRQKEQSNQSFATPEEQQVVNVPSGQVTANPSQALSLSPNPPRTMQPNVPKEEKSAPPKNYSHISSQWRPIETPKQNQIDQQKQQQEQQAVKQQTSADLVGKAVQATNKSLGLPTKPLFTQPKPAPGQSTLEKTKQSFSKLKGILK